MLIFDGLSVTGLTPNNDFKLQWGFSISCGGKVKHEHCMCVTLIALPYENLHVNR